MYYSSLFPVLILLDPYPGSYNRESNCLKDQRAIKINRKSGFESPFDAFTASQLSPSAVCVCVGTNFIVNDTYIGAPCGANKKVDNIRRLRA